MTRNSNCLQGLQCPVCKSSEPFRISATATILMYDDGSDEVGDIDWEQDSHIQCERCKHQGTVKTFAEQPTAPRPGEVDAGDEFRRRMFQRLESYIGRVGITESTLMAMRLDLNSIVMQMHQEGWFPPDYLSFDVVHEGMGVLKLLVARNFKKYPMTEQEFEDLVGRPPENDDMHRVNCTEAGTTGHFLCGWCMDHGRPRFVCGCLEAEYTPKEPRKLPGGDLA
jgi:hypothetical protein